MAYNHVTAILVAISLLKAVNCQWNKTIYVATSGAQNTSCWAGEKDNPCGSINLALRGIDGNSTVIFILPGVYTLQFGNETEIKNMSRIAIIGTDFTKPIILKCESKAGLAFYQSDHIVLKNLTFDGCGMQHNSTSRDFSNSYFSFMLFHTSLYFLFCRDVTMEYVAVQKSHSTGVVFYNTIGHNVVKSSNFSSNGYVNVNGTIGPEQYGGGVVIEFSCCVPGDLNCTPIDDPQLVSNANYMITQTNFSNNFASARDYPSIFPAQNEGRNYMGFGKGGGLCLIFKGNAQNNTISLSSSYFQKNVAQFGGGLYTGFFDDAFGNVVHLESSTIVQCDAAFYLLSSIVQPTAEGGGAMIVYGAVGNSIYVNTSIFEHNRALSYGGSLSVHYIITEESSNNYPWFVMENTTILSSSAKLGAGGYFISHYPSSVPVEIQLYNVSWRDNNLLETCFPPGVSPCSAAVYLVNVRLSLFTEIVFDTNIATGLEIHGGSVVFYNNSKIHFNQNHGENGGAIKISHCGKILIEDKAEIYFSQNTASHLGGAIYDSGCFQSRLDYPFIGPKGCFIQHIKDLPPNEWNVMIDFSNNTAGIKPNAIYAESLLSCVWPQGDSLLINETAVADTFCWSGWHYDNESCLAQISSGLAFINITSPSDLSSLHSPPGKPFYISVQAYNAYGDIIEDNIKICYHAGFGSLYDNKVFSENVSRCTSASTSTDKIPITIYATNDAGNCDAYSTQSIVLLITADTPPHPQVMFEMKFDSCPDYTTFQCPECLLRIDQNHGLTCVDSDTYVYTTTIVNSSMCPLTASLKNSEKYCWNLVNMTTPASLVGGQCPYHQSPFCKPIANFTNETCPDNRSGRLCGKCDSNHGIAINTIDFQCIECYGNGWSIYLSIELFFTTAVFIVIVAASISLNAGGTNAFIFFSQIVTLKYPGLSYPSWVFDENHHATNNTVVRGFTVLYSLSNLDFITPFPYQPFCLSKSLTTIEAIALEYVAPVYLLYLTLVLYVWMTLYTYQCKPVFPIMNRILKPYQKRCRYKPSLLESFAVIFIISYTRIAATSLKFLSSTSYYNLAGDKEGKAFYYDGSLDYFGEGHIAYAIIALFMLVMFIVLPIVFLTLYPFIQNHLYRRRIRNPRLLALTYPFNGCFKSSFEGKIDYRYFAGIYLILRIIVVSLYLIHDVEVLLVCQITVAVVAASLFMTLRPYRKDIFNTIDGLLFLYLAFLSGLSASGYAAICYKGLLYVPLIIVLVYILFRIGQMFVAVSRSRNKKRTSGGRTEDFDEDEVSERSILLTSNAEIQEDASNIENLFTDRLLNPKKYNFQPKLVFEEEESTPKQVALQDVST